MNGLARIPSTIGSQLDITGHMEPACSHTPPARPRPDTVLVIPTAGTPAIAGTAQPMPRTCLAGYFRRNLSKAATPKMGGRERKNQTNTPKCEMANLLPCCALVFQ